MNIYDFNTMKFLQKRTGVFVKIVTGEKMQMALEKLDYGVANKHSHPNEQMGYVLKGEVEITIADETKKCGPGIAYYIPSNVLHGFKVLSKEGAEWIEIFSPPKEENKLS